MQVVTQTSSIKVLKEEKERDRTTGTMCYFSQITDFFFYIIGIVTLEHDE